LSAVYLGTSETKNVEEASRGSKKGGENKCE
jgi:hypothetical protein